MWKDEEEKNNFNNNNNNNFNSNNIHYLQSTETFICLLTEGGTPFEAIHK